MMQRKQSNRGWLVLLVCAVVLVFAVVFDRRIASREEASPAVPSGLKAEASPPAVPSAPRAEASAAAISVAAPSAASTAAEEAAREASWREAREATIRMQERLRAEQRARTAVQLQEAKNERCVDGQRMKRVENGWVQAGACGTNQ